MLKSDGVLFDFDGFDSQLSLVLSSGRGCIAETNTPQGKNLLYTGKLF